LGSACPEQGKDDGLTLVDREALTGAHGRANDIEVRGLTKQYGRVRAVDDLSFSVPSGAVVAFIGPNGAGKTTTLRMLLGLVSPTAGTAEILGSSIANPASYLSRVGAMIEGPAFYPMLSGEKNLRVLAALGGSPPGRIPVVLETVGLADRRGDRVGDYSLGMRQRLGIAAALLPDPTLLVLDEPTNGLDPAGILEMRRLLRALADEGRTVFISSHILAEIEHIADWLVMVKEGKLLFEGSLSEAESQQHNTLFVRTEPSEGVETVAEIARQAGFAVEEERGGIRITSPASFAPTLNRLAAQRGITLSELHAEHANLEETFLAMMKDSE